MAARDTTVVVSHETFYFAHVTKGTASRGREILTFENAIAALLSEGSSCLYSSPWGTWDSVHEARYEIWAESVLRGRRWYDKQLNYDRSIHSPVKWVHWFGKPVALMELQPHKEKLEDTAELYRAWDRESGKWWLQRYEQAMADPMVWKLRNGLVLVDGVAELTVVDRCIEEFGPP